MKRRRRKKPIKRGLRRPFEWFGIFLGVAILSNLPHSWLFGLCDFIAAVMYRFDRRGRALSLANLRLMFDPSAEVGKDYSKSTLYDPTRREELIIRRSYRNMARTIGHVFWTCRNAGKRAASVARLDDSCRKCLTQFKPVVTVSAHLGCWEVLSQLVHLEGHKMMSVAKDIGTPAMTRLLMRSRKSIGQEIVHADGAFRHLIAGLRAGSDIGLLVDQVVKPKDGGVWVRFLGRPVPVSVAPAFLSAKSHTPVLVAWSRPLKDGTYRCELISIRPWEKGADIWGVTQRCMLDLERVILRHPSCWVLNYRYFRKTPTAEELAQLESREREAKGRCQ